MPCIHSFLKHSVWTDVPIYFNVFSILIVWIFSRYFKNTHCSKKRCCMWWNTCDHGTCMYLNMVALLNEPKWYFLEDGVKDIKISLFIFQSEFLYYSNLLLLVYFGHLLPERKFRICCFKVLSNLGILKQTHPVIETFSLF